jgi:hypothetical protein
MIDSIENKSSVEKILGDAHNLLFILNTPDPDVELGKISLFVHHSLSNEKLGITSKPDNRWQLPDKIRITHSNLKAKVRHIAGVGEVTASNHDDKLAYIERQLVETYKLVDKGLNLLEGITSRPVEYLPKVFYLDLLKNKHPEVEIFPNAYFLLSALEIASFELAMIEIRDHYHQIKGKPEFYEKYICATEFLTTAQSSFVRGLEHTYPSMLEEKDKEIESTLDSIKAAINIKEGHDRYTSKSTLDSLNKYAPLVIEVHEELAKHSSSRGKKSHCCMIVAYRHPGINLKTLKNHYDKYIKNPSIYNR